MKPQRILLPVDVAKCPLEVFALVYGFAGKPEVTVILLHVITLNIVVRGNRVFQELAAEAEAYLQRLADQHLPPMASTILHVRLGEPGKEILDEARAESPSLIILSSYGPSFWNRLKAVCKPASSSPVSPLVEKVAREARCEVFVVAAKTRFNCEMAWGRPFMKAGRTARGQVGNHRTPELV